MAFCKQKIRTLNLNSLWRGSLRQYYEDDTSFTSLSSSLNLFSVEKASDLDKNLSKGKVDKIEKRNWKAMHLQVLGFFGCPLL